MNSKTIKIQDWHMPRITRRDQLMIDRGYRSFFRRRGIVVADGFRDIVSGGARGGQARKEQKGKK